MNSPYLTQAATGAIASCILGITLGHSYGLSPADAECPPGSSWNGAFCATDEDGPEEGVTTSCHQGDPLVLNVPCRIGDYLFVSAPHDCYIGDISSDVPAGDPRWEGHLPGDGSVYRCMKLTAVGQGDIPIWGHYRDFWAAEAPGEQQTIVVDPEELAQQVLGGVAFEALEVGLAPRPLGTDPHSIGLVGAPVWMWVTNAGPTTWGPIEESATAGGITVTVTAEVEDVTWDMGDNTAVTCDTPGHPYASKLGVRPSPSCGHTYTQTSADQAGTAYTVTATPNWTASWSASTGAEGTLDPPEPDATTARLRIGERQVIETS